MNAEAWYRANGWIVRPAVAALLAAFIIALTALTGIARGMDHKISWGPTSEQRAISIALSEFVYGLHLGYVGLGSVNNKLVEIWNRGAKVPDDPILIENSSNAELMNEALRAAASLGPQKIGYLSDRTLLTTWYDDMGEVDFFKIAFRLFGLQIQSYYYLFFAVLAFSAIVFILTYHDDIYALVALLCTLFAFYVELHLNAFSVDAPTFPGMRTGSTLALVPMWYFIFLLGRGFSIGRLVGAVIELFILIFAWRIRGSVSWIFILLLALAIIAALPVWLQRARGERSWWGFVRTTAQWPILLMTFGLAANYLYTRVELHPIYFTDDALPYHGIWHSAYLGMAFTPEMFTPRVRESINKYIGGDGVGADALGAYGEMDYLDRIHFIPWDGSDASPPARVSVWTGQMKPRFHEDIMRRAVFEAIEEHPVDAVVLYAYKKPIAIFGTLKSAFAKAPGLTWMWCVLIGGMCSALMFLSLHGQFDGRRLTELVATSGGVVIIGALPNLWAYPGLYTMSDVVLSLVVFALLALGAIVAAVVRSGATLQLPGQPRKSLLT